ncbi:hypothetical protein [Methylosinus sp. RM1]|uniref:hypothetical protein n=1 Tax=Methylosinus sp. RM1 TaxID=2583817 RepID=UPI00140E1DA1|nr:hypothetical protein [Methylosinus sp. RM1]
MLMLAVISIDMRIFLPPCINFPRRQKRRDVFSLHLWRRRTAAALFAERRHENIDVRDGTAALRDDARIIEPDAL